MKYLLSFLLIASIFAFNERAKTRYFFVGYSSSNTSGGIWFNTSDGQFIDYKRCKNTIRNYLKITDSLSLSITSIYEFASKADYDRFISTYK
jgi:hypothetical protein